MTKITKIIVIILILIYIFGSTVIFNSKYIRTGTIVELRDDAIVVHHDSDPSFVIGDVLPLENASETHWIYKEKTTFYDANGNEISYSALKIGNKVKVQMFPRTYGKIFQVRKCKTIKELHIME